MKQDTVLGTIAAALFALGISVDDYENSGVEKTRELRLGAEGIALLCLSMKDEDINEILAELPEGTDKATVEEFLEYLAKSPEPCGIELVNG